MPTVMNRSDVFSGDVFTEAQSYWLGFFCADGGLHPSLKQFGFQLASKDRAHLEKLAVVLRKEIKDGCVLDQRTGNTYFWCRLTLYGTQVVASIMDKGIPLNKTEFLKGNVFDHIPESLVHHFVRGYFDGDGCISHVGIAEYRVTIVGCKDFLGRMQEIINSTPKIEFAPPHKRGRSLHGISLCGTDRINAFRTWLYRDASIFLERKKNIFDTVPIHRGVSRHKGVYRRNNSWIARVYENKRMRTIKQCKTEEEAAAVLREYNQKKAA
jgi:hypothetical protein